MKSLWFPPVASDHAPAHMLVFLNTFLAVRSALRGSIMRPSGWITAWWERHFPFPVNIWWWISATFKGMCLQTQCSLACIALINTIKMKKAKTNNSFLIRTLVCCRGSQNRFWEKKQSDGSLTVCGHGQFVAKVWCPPPQCPPRGRLVCEVNARLRALTEAVNIMHASVIRHWSCKPDDYLWLKRIPPQINAVCLCWGFATVGVA